MSDQAVDGVSGEVAVTEELVDLAGQSEPADSASTEDDVPSASATDTSRIRASRIGTVARRLNPVPASSKGRMVALVAASFVGVAGAAVAVTTAFQIDQMNKAIQAGEEARATVQDALPKVLGYSYRTVDETFPKAAGEHLTGKFREDYLQLGESVIRPAAKSDEIVTEATVIATSTVEATDDEATLLVFVNQVTDSKGQSGRRLDGSRIRVVVQRDADQWKISALQPV